MVVDYDSPRHKSEEDVEADSIEELKAAQASVATRRAAELEGTPDAEEFELPGADLSDLSLVVEVKPQQANEFTCMGCFLVRHRSQLKDSTRQLCVDCA